MWKSEFLSSPAVMTAMTIYRKPVSYTHLAHGIYAKAPRLDVERLSEIRQVVDIPLVLHGASGLPDEAVQECVRRGICKVNFATELRVAYSAAVKAVLAEKPETIDPKAYGKKARAAVKELVMDKIQMLGSQGKAQE